MPDQAQPITAEQLADRLALPLEALADPLPVPTLRSIRGQSPFDVTLRPPGSKSLTNRALLLASLAGGRSELRGALVDAVDTRVMVRALVELGAGIEVEGTTIRVRGVGGQWQASGAGEKTLDLENAGTAVRFLAAACVLSPGPVVITGNDRMRQRPISELASALGDLGATVESLGEPGCPPIRVTPPVSLPECGQVFFDELPSSQFVSAVLLLGAFLPGGLSVEIDGEATSASYVRMTLGLLDAVGVSVRSSADLRVLRVATRGGAMASGFELDIEPDASGASVFWAAAASVPGARVTVEGVDEAGLQGDLMLPSVLARMGAEATSVPAEDGHAGPSLTVRGGATISPVMADMRDMPDAAMALVVLAALAGGPSMIRGLHTLRVKETDRLHALKTELDKVGVSVELDVHGEPGAVRIEPPSKGLDRSGNSAPVVFDTYDDHRMAMALSLIALHRPSVSIADPGCVRKTYPGFWAELARLYEG
jgi:3-phosphoshikimate 1-carboxyvinyltransferase